MIRGACYVRVSTENQLENYSLEEQTERLRAFCKAKDIAIGKIYTDGGYSGGNINRPALQQMLRDIELGGIDIVVVYKLDRLSRSQKDTLMLIEDRFLAHQVDFISVNENFDTSTPFGRAMIGILSVFAQLEKEQITERFTMGRIGRARNGYYHGGAVAPTGYDYKDGLLVINEYEAMQVRELYERFAKGYSLHSCWQYMSSRYTTKYGAWTSEALVRNVLKNNVYTGKVKFDGQSYDGRHTPIITEELFERVQQRLESAKRDAVSCTRSPFRAGTLLSSLLYCGKCGARFHGEHGNYTCYSRSKGDKKYIRDPDCKNRKWKITELDSLVTDAIAGLDFGPPVKVKKEREKGDFSKRIHEIDAAISKLIELCQTGSVAVDIISAKIKVLTKEKEYLLEQSQKNNKPKEEIITFNNRFSLLAARGSLSEKRACLAQLIERIVLDGERISILLR